MRFIYTGATPDYLASGRPVASRDVIDLTRREQAENARLIDAGLLRPRPVKPRKKEGDK